MCFLLSQLKSCWSFINDQLQRGVNKDVLAMKRSMLERRDTLKEMESNTNLSPILKEQVPINLKGVDKVAHLISRVGSFCEGQKCYTTGLKGKVSFTRKKNSFTVQLEDP